MAGLQKEKNAGKILTVLAVDTAGTGCSVALAGPAGPVAELNHFHGQTHSRHLAGMVDRLLEMAQVNIAKVDLFAVDAGPGTFTGLRIGLAAVKGWAAATGKPAVGVSSLDVLARQAATAGGEICCMLDARRGEVYTARYAVRGRQVEKLTAEAVLAPEKAVADGNRACLYIGSGAVVYRERIADVAGSQAHFAQGDANYLRALTVARLGWEHLPSNDTDSAGGLVPNYIRRSDAQINYGKY